MLIELLFNIFAKVFVNIFTNVSIPEFPFLDYIFDIVDIFLENGITAASVLIPMAYVVDLFTFTLFAEAFTLLFFVVMFVLRKIPLLDID